MSGSEITGSDTLRGLNGDDRNLSSPTGKAPPSPLVSSPSNMSLSPTPLSPHASKVTPDPHSAPSRASSSALKKPLRDSVASSSASTEHADSPVDRKPGEILPLSIPTKHEHLFSGFSYHQDLYDLRVSPKQWEYFNEDMQKALSPSSFDRMTARLSKFKVLPIGPIYLTLSSIKAANNRAIEKRILQSLQDDVGENVGELAATIRRWNEETFQPLGLDVNLQLTSSAMKRIEKEEKKRKEKEKKTRAKYGTTTFYPDEEEDASSPDKVDAGKKYKIVISRFEASPPYAEEDVAALKEKEGRDSVPMLDGTPSGPVEMPDTSTSQIAELPVESSMTRIESRGGDTVAELPGSSTNK